MIDLMMNATRVRELIAERCDGWAVDSVEDLGEGDFSAAYFVDGAWVFRFAKHARARASLEREACLLPQIADRIDVCIPSPEIISFEASPGFMAHRLLPGPALTRERYLALAEPERERCAGQLARFLVQMHATDAAVARECGVPTIDYGAHYAGLLDGAREHAFANLSMPERSFAESWLAGSSSSREPSDFPRVVLHGDLSPDHVLYDKASRSISAVIDFGDVVIGDPAWDLVYIYEDYGLDFLRRLVSGNPVENPRSLLERVFRFYVLDTIEWVVRCAREGSSELGEAISSLAQLRVDGEDRRGELLSLGANE